MIKLNCIYLPERQLARRLSDVIFKLNMPTLRLIGRYKVGERIHNESSETAHEKAAIKKTLTRTTKNYKRPAVFSG